MDAETLVDALGTWHSDDSRERRLSELCLWLSRLRGALLEERPVQHILSLTAGFTGLDACLMDWSERIVAYELLSGHADQHPDMLAEVLQKGFSPAISRSQIEWYRAMIELHPQGFMGNVSSSGIPTDTPAFIMPFRTSRGNRFQLHLIGQTANAPHSQLLCAEAADVMKVALDLEETEQTETSSGLVGDLLSHRFSSNELRERCLSFGWNHMGSHAIVRGILLHGPYSSQRLDSLVAAMSGALGVACVERYGDASVALVALHSVADWRRCYTNLEKLAGMQEAVFGLSDPFDDLLNASDAYEDARYATLACLKHPHTTTGSDNDRPGPSSPPSHSIDFSRTSGTCLAYDDCKMDLLREGLRRQVSPYNITPLRFKCMQDYDRSNGTDYLVTVLEYARNLRHHTRACESLSIHRGTLDYRLKKVRQLFGIDVDSPDTLADIHLLYEAGALSIEEKHSE